MQGMADISFGKQGGLIMSRKVKQIKRKCIAFFLLFAAVLAYAMTGCGNENEESAYHIEYLNKDRNRLVDAPYEPVATDTDGMIREFLAVLSSDSDNVEYRKPIPNDVEVISYSLDGALLTIHFDEDYSKMDTVEEVLCRAAVVRTMTQIKGIDCVAFYVADAPLIDVKGNLVGSMNQDSFIENPGEQINSIQNTTLTLYFSNENGDGLVKEVREEVYYVDRLRYVSFDEAFRNQDYKVNEAVVVYSIVDSLSELSTINKVQISVNGDTSGVYRDNFKLAEMYDRNMDYVAGTAEIVTEMATEE